MPKPKGARMDGRLFEKNGFTVDHWEAKIGFSERKLKAAMVLAGYTGYWREVAEVIGIKTNALNNRFAKGRDFSRDEICKIIDKFRIGPEDVIEIFFPSTYAGKRMGIPQLEDFPPIDENTGKVLPDVDDNL